MYQSNQALEEGSGLEPLIPSCIQDNEEHPAEQTMNENFETVLYAPELPELTDLQHMPYSDCESESDNDSIAPCILKCACFLDATHSSAAMVAVKVLPKAQHP